MLDPIAGLVEHLFENERDDVEIRSQTREFLRRDRRQQEGSRVVLPSRMEYWRTD